MKKRYILYTLVVLFSIKNTIGQEITYPKRVIQTAIIDSILTSPCHYATSYLLLKIKDPANIKNDTTFLSQGLRGYSHSYSYLQKLYPDITTKDYSRDKRKEEVLIGLYYHSQTSRPILEWISEKWRENSFIQLKIFLEKEGVYKSFLTNTPPEKITSKDKEEQIKTSIPFLPCARSYFQPDLLYERQGTFPYTKNGKNMIAIEHPVGSGQWRSYAEEKKD